ncbi:pentatricopeptide repeat-containing protein At4g04370 [Morus notabilis]|uniref:pentatricopeptide repeat-containing protein At4g04370 n=1 Tax=Morus notabilis TaxID=981085 RepID=UPI000CED078F|nr:pentatricopeptide repeat-containing protein At4g04370 [Morus notabilis]
MVMNPLYLNALKPSQTAKTTSTRSFNAIINRLSSQASHHEVLITFSSMLQSNTPPDTHTFPSLFKACASLHLFPLGISLHQCVVVNGFSSDPYVASSLVSFYAKFGCVGNARKVFDDMPERNIVPWTSIIGCYSCTGDVDQAVLLFSEMRHQGFQPSPVTLLSLLPGVSELAHVRCLHGCAVSYGFEGNVSLMNSILSVYSKCGGIEDARSLFEFMTGKDIVSWNSLMSGYAQCGNFTEVFQLFYRMRDEGIRPDKQTFGSVVSASATQSNFKLGKSVHGQILRAGIKLDSHIETSLVTMYMKRRSIDAAFKIFERMKYKDVVLWTAMISGLVQNDCSDRALIVFCQMIKSRMQPSTATVASALAACAKQGSFNVGTSIHCYVLRQGIALDTPAQNSLITMYAKCGHLNQARTIFARMGKRDLVSWNAMVAGYAQNGHLSEGLSFLSEMRETLQKPDSLTVVSLLQACASIGALHQGKWIHSFVIRSCLRPCILVDTALVDMYSKCGDLEMAQKCFNEMLEHDRVSWGTMISGYGCHGKGETALRLYTEFLRAGIEPDQVIFLTVLAVCSHNGLVNQGLSIYQSMTKDFGIAPNLEHRACVVDLLSRARRVEEAYEFYKKTFPEPVVDVLDAGNYVQLAHSFAAMDRWDGVNEAWTQMRSLGLTKLPGWSYVELHGTIETFFTSHNSHPRLEEIVLTLKTLRTEMRKLGHNSDQPDA